MLFSPFTLFDHVESNCVLTVTKLIRVLNIKVTKKTIKESLEKHPNYPSLLSVSDSLNTWKINNLSLEATPENLKEFPVPFMVQIARDRETYFVLVKELHANYVVVSDPVVPKWRKMPMKEFIDKWTSIAMLIGADENAGEKDFKSIRKLELINKIPRYIFLGLILSTILLICINYFTRLGVSSLPPIFLILLKSIGCYITTILLRYEIDQSDPAVKQMCKSGNKFNCDAILQSHAAKRIDIFTWSEIGFIYFVSGFAILLTTYFNTQALSVLAWLNVLALPYTVFSVYYQWRVAKQWCILCLSVQAILVLEALTGLLGGMYTTLTPITPLELARYFSFAIGTALIWLLIKPILLEAREGKKDKRELLRLINNPQVLKGLLHRQKAIEHDTTGLGITLGSSVAKNKIVKVCNPYCGPCSAAHPIIEDLLKENNDLQVQIIFTANDENDKRSLTVKHLLAIADKNNPILLQNALDDWYRAPKKDYDAFSVKYKLGAELLEQGAKLAAMKDWCAKTDILGTPTFFINGYQLPELFSTRDLKLFLSDVTTN
jgi:uncharacterized membrane protein/thiol-disulfide isomerase/thioredoxin